MSERKVLQKYYPPDFDPSALQRRRGPKNAGPRIQQVRIMCPVRLGPPNSCKIVTKTNTPL